MSLNVKKMLSGLLALIVIATMMSCVNVRAQGSNQGKDGKCQRYKNDKEYTIKEGDSLYKLSEKFYGSPEYWEELAYYNGIKDPKALQLNVLLHYVEKSKDLLKATGGHVYPIQKGDTLSEICLEYYGTADEDTVNKLAIYNGIEDPNLIIVGNFLSIPSKEKLDKVKLFDCSAVTDNPLTLR